MQKLEELDILDHHREIIVKIWKTNLDPYPGLLCKCIVGCIFNSVGLITTREIPCMCSQLLNENLTNS
jgi:hypothetical protein